MNNGYTTISVVEYARLLVDSEELARLNAYGVNNWEGYSDAPNDVEGIFEED